MREIKMIKNVFKIILMMWLAFAFVLWDFNPINWSIYTRFWFILPPILYLLVGAFLVVLLELKDEIKKGEKNERN